MKYMGSKRSMLQNGLGELLKSEFGKHDRVVDLFCGSASVSWFVAMNSELPVFSVDLQEYATALAEAVTCRTRPVDAARVSERWISSARKWATSHDIWEKAAEIECSPVNTAAWCKRSRQMLQEVKLNRDCLVTRCYGGYYFSVTQALLIDGFLQSLPKDKDQQKVCLAATIIVASECAASPGHTAQPFRPTRTAGQFLREAWKRDPVEHAVRAMNLLGSSYATCKGKTTVGDAVTVAGTLAKSDLVFVDPPYSAVHYSRFYHVLETIARGIDVEVSGAGRYPPPEKRPKSSFSKKGGATAAFRSLVESLANSGSTVVMTFPAGSCSNGLTGELVRQISEERFTVLKQAVKSRFSSLGGNNDNRNAVQNSEELILLLRPKSIHQEKKSLPTTEKKTRIR